MCVCVSREIVGVANRLCPSHLLGFSLVSAPFLGGKKKWKKGGGGNALALSIHDNKSLCKIISGISAFQLSLYRFIINTLGVFPTRQSSKVDIDSNIGVNV
jgi:hypothetical protein